MSLDDNIDRHSIFPHLFPPLGFKKNDWVGYVIPS